jgi:hypothetical protein
MEVVSVALLSMLAFAGDLDAEGKSCGDAIANGVGDGPSLAMRLKMYDDAWVTLNHIF